MEIKVKPKTYGPVFVHIDRQRTVFYGRDEGVIDKPSPPTDTPADTLLFALAACIAISLHMEAEKSRLTLDPFWVRAVCKKAQDLPSRFDRFEVSVPRSITDDHESAERLIKGAKSICTVSNTLDADVTLRLI